MTKKSSEVTHAHTRVMLSCRCDNEEWIHSGIFRPWLANDDEALAAQREVA